MLTDFPLVLHIRKLAIITLTASLPSTGQLPEIRSTSMETAEATWAGHQRLRQDLQLFTATGQGTEFL